MIREEGCRRACVSFTPPSRTPRTHFGTRSPIVSRPSAAGEIWSDDITSRPEEPIAWIWQGLIAPGNLTLMTSAWKSGKTTLLSVLLGSRVAGGSLGGLSVSPGKTLIVSEEPATLWAER